MRSNLNVDIKFYADKVLDILGNSLSKYTDKISGTKSGGSSGGRGQGSRGSGNGYGSCAQRKGGRRSSRWPEIILSLLYGSLERQLKTQED